MFKFCPECGTKATSGKFCAECGFKFDTGSAPSSSGSYTSNNGSSQIPTAIPVYNNKFSPDKPIPQAQVVGAPVTMNGAMKSKKISNKYVPPSATGSDAQQVYARCMDTIRAAKGGGNDAGVKQFKLNCKLYGQNQIQAHDFHASLVTELGVEGTKNMVPELVRLIPDEAKRRELLEYDATVIVPAPSSGNSGRNSFLNCSSSSSDRSSFVGGVTPGMKSHPDQKGGILKGRYADHPNCDICNCVFDVTKRRHQCRYCGIYICSSCSPLKLMIPPGQEIENAKGYDPSIPQRVCIQCAPRLHPLQDELVQTYGKFKQENVHQAASRIHVPYSANLEKECRNAADIIGNFFRDDWGAAKDRSIPVTFLEKAHGLAIMTIVKIGFLVSGKAGTGLVVAKLPDGSWSAPSAIGTVGLSGGFEIGGEIVEVMIILGSQGAVRVFHKPQVNIGAGLDLAVGPYGRSADAAAAVGPGGLNANYSYSQSKGFFAGISLQGAIIATRNDLNTKFYGRELEAAILLSGDVEQPNAARPLYEALQLAMEGVSRHREEDVRRISIMGACRNCGCPTFVPHTAQVWNKNCKSCKHVH